MASQFHSTASKFAQLLGETIIHHTPVTAEITQQAKDRARTLFLDALEDHTAEISGPLIETLLETGTMPDELAVMLRSIHDPEHAVSAIAGQFLVYGVGFAVASQVLQPFLQLTANALWSKFPDKPIDPANLVTMAVRGLDPATTDVTPIADDVFGIAAKSGYNKQAFQAMVDAAGSPPSPQDLFEMFRRGIIDKQGLIQGLRQGDTKDSWIADFIKLAYTTPTPIDMVRAAVQNQLTYEEANAIAIQLGLEPQGEVGDNPDWFKILFDIAGRPPGPVEVGHAANRGIVPWEGLGAALLTFQQGIAESDVKTKWTPVLQKLMQYYPPPVEARTLYQAGALTLEQMHAYLVGNGLDPNLIAAFSHQATIQEVAQERALAKGEVIAALYDGIISAEQSLSLLSDLGYVGKTAEYIVEITGMRREIQAVNRAVSRIGNLYVNFKMTATDASNALHTLGIPDEQTTRLLAIWETQRKPEVRLPTQRELAEAVRYAGLPFDEAVQHMENLGYTQYDATLIISALSHLPPPGGWPPMTDTGVQV